MLSVMTLWRVAPYRDTAPMVKHYPRIPKHPIPGEDVTTPRICFCDSIEHCIDAITESDRHEILSSGRFIAYRLEVDTEDKMLRRPDDIHYLVPDALLTQEYWYLKPVTLVSIPMKIIEFCDYIDYDVDESYKESTLDYLKQEGVYLPEMDDMSIAEIFVNIPTWMAAEIVERDELMEVHRFSSFCANQIA